MKKLLVILLLLPFIGCGQSIQGGSENVDVSGFNVRIDSVITAVDSKVSANSGLFTGVAPWFKAGETGEYREVMRLGRRQSSDAPEYTVFSGDFLGDGKDESHLNTISSTWFLDYRLSRGSTFGMKNAFRFYNDDDTEHKLDIYDYDGNVKTSLSSKDSFFTGEVSIDSLDINNHANFENTIWVNGDATIAGQFEVNDETTFYGYVSVDSEMAINSNLSIALSTAPATNASTCTSGEIRITTDYIYVCTAANSWKRATLSTY